LWFDSLIFFVKMKTFKISIIAYIMSHSNTSIYVTYPKINSLLSIKTYDVSYNAISIYISCLSKVQTEPKSRLETLYYFRAYLIQKYI